MADNSPRTNMAPEWAVEMFDGCPQCGCQSAGYTAFSASMGRCRCPECKHAWVIRQRGYSTPSETLWEKTNRERKPQRERFNRAAGGRRAELMLMLRQSGLTYKAVGRLAGVSGDRVRQITEKHERTRKSRIRKFVERIPRGRIDAGTNAERDKWHVFTPETNWNEMNGRQPF